MRISRIFTGQALSPGEQVRLGEAASHYVTRVLKLQAGDPLVLFNGDGADYAGQLVAAEHRVVRVAVDTRLPAAPESPLKVTLVQAISRGERMDLTLQKATELGVAAVQPVFSHRVEVRLQGDRLDKRMAHWRAVLRSACEQCGRAKVPELAAAVDLEEWLSRPTAPVRVVLDPAADQALSALSLPDMALELLVGPEGGFSDRERVRLRIAGVTGVRLGPRTLRTETAGPAALAVLQAVAGDF